MGQVTLGLAFYNLALMGATIYTFPLWATLIGAKPKLRNAFLDKLTGRTPKTLGFSENIWFHAVSVGEVVASIPLVEAMASRWREKTIFLSTVTSTGQSVAKDRLKCIKGTFYLPYDFIWSVERAVRRIRPRLFITAETELWPNLFLRLDSRGVLKAVVNGRISDRSYPRYLRMRALFKEVLRCIELICMQSEQSAERAVSLGAPEKRVHVVGNLKFDIPIKEAEEEQWRKVLGIPPKVPVIVAGSTHQGEEEVILGIFQRLSISNPDLWLVLAPRAPERFSEVERISQRMRVPIRRRSSNGPLEARVILLDTIGELGQVYSVAKVAFVGGSLCPKGGHNPLEPASLGRAVVFGPHMENFREIGSALIDANGAKQVRDSLELEKCLEELVSNPLAADEMGSRARAAVEANRGATWRTMALLEEILEERQS